LKTFKGMGRQLHALFISAPVAGEWSA
jgi:hypothetical protein